VSLAVPLLQVNFDKKQTQQSADSYGDLPFDKSVTVNPGEKVIVLPLPTGSSAVRPHHVVPHTC
jgi:hypothetical protein